MSESVEQAALRRASESADWQGRAEREASALLDGSHMLFAPRDNVIRLLAAAWLQGFNLGAHETLSGAETAFENLRAAL